jgi:antitoxin component YwqK of YwqJK toxin-antitoxin module
MGNPYLKKNNIMKIESIIFWLLIISHSTFSQRVHLLDSILINNSYYYSKSKIYFDFERNRYDSLSSINNINGDLDSIEIFSQQKSGVLDGDIFYLAKFDTLLSGKFCLGVPCGQFIINNRDEIISFNMVNGKVEGEKKVLDKRDSSMVVANYSGGKLNENFYILNKDLSFQYVAFYNNGLLQGGEVWFHPNGVIRTLSVYNNGKIVDGSYHYFTMEGEIYLSISCKDGHCSPIVDD